MVAPVLGRTARERAAIGERVTAGLPRAARPRASPVWERVGSLEDFLALVSVDARAV